jgi:ADP-ribose pyrophosphatase YjhB (NUDIX family)
MYKIYFDDRVLYLDSKNNTNSNIIHEYSSKDKLLEFILNFEFGKNISATITHPNPDELLSIFMSVCDNYIEAAGGIVTNPLHQILVIFRRDKWDLPKGKVDKGETIKQAAIREVEEETGVKKIKLGNLITCTYHTYRLKNKLILKKTYWFIIYSDDKQKLKPQIEEDITDIKWVDDNCYDEILQNTYPTIIDVLIDAKLISNK